MEQTKATVKIHDAKEIPPKILWTGHTLTGVLVILSLALIVAARGPRRKDALQKMMNEPKK